MPLLQCPDAHQLRDYLLGRLKEAELDGLSKHLSSCGNCEDSIRELDSATDDLVRQLRQPVTAEPLLDEPELQRLLPRLERVQAEAPSSALTEPRPISAAPEAAATSAPPGSSLGRYRVLEKVGQGGMGTVYKARDPELDRLVAIKVPQLDPNRPDHTVAVHRFLREARAAASVRHTHVCPIHDVGEQDGRPYAVMDFIEGRSLSALLKEGELPLRQAVELVRKVALGLAAVHGRGLIHRDVKSGNILLDGHGEPFLTDFGLVRPVVKSEHLTREGGILGTPEYMAPEQAAGKEKEVSPRTDIYSLGVVLYRLLTGRMPFEGQPLHVLYQITHQTPATPRSRRPELVELDTALEAIVLKATAFRSEDRFQTAGAFAAALEAWSAHSKTTSASQTTDWLPEDCTSPRTTPKRRWAAVAAVAASAVLLIGGGMLYSPIISLFTAKDDKQSNGAPENVTVPAKLTPSQPAQQEKQPGKTEPAVSAPAPGGSKIPDLSRIPDVTRIPIESKIPRVP